MAAVASIVAILSNAWHVQAAREKLMVTQKKLLTLEVGWWGKVKKYILRQIGCTSLTGSILIGFYHFVQIGISAFLGFGVFP